MKNDENGDILADIRRLLNGPLTGAGRLHLAAASVTSKEMLHGYHCHDAWELFFPLQAGLKFEIAGLPMITIPAGHLLLVPRACWHLAVDRLAQAPRLRLFVVNLPGEDEPFGRFNTGPVPDRQGVTLSPAELSVWSARAGAPPASLIEQAVQALHAGAWGYERAVGILRLLMAAAAEAIEQTPDTRQSLDARRVADAQLFLESHYFEQRLSVPAVARELGLSASHLAAIFRKQSGRTLDQALLDLRLKRATELLLNSPLSVKEIAVVTGWSNQLYFSAAYRRRYGQPPSAMRAPKAPAVAGGSGG